VGPSGSVRPLSQKDLEGVARLHARVTAHAAGGSVADRVAYLREVFLRLTRDGASPPLVHEDRDGTISGFLGVGTRAVILRGRRLTMAVGSQFMIEPGSRAPLAALGLLRTFLEGPQALSVADEATADARRLWERLGGRTSLSRSVGWVRILRPARALAALLAGRPSLGRSMCFVRPAARLLDAGLAPVARGILQPARTDLSVAPLDAGTFDEAARLVTQQRGLHPVYDAGSLARVVRRLASYPRRGVLRQVAFRERGGVLVGWGLYWLGASGVADVARIGAGPTRLRSVFDALAADAFERGAVALSGRVEPALLEVLTAGPVVLHRKGPWVLVHARSAEVLEAIEAPDSDLSRLEGELGLRFEPSL
jgi:hypothetical protein